MGVLPASRVFWDADEEQVFKNGLHVQDTIVEVIEKLVDRIEQLENEVKHLKVDKILLEKGVKFV